MIALNSLTQWDKASNDEQALIVAAVVQTLPAAFSFMGFEWHALGAQRHHLATFRWQDVEFSLLPGYDDELGVDRDALFAQVAPAVSATFPDKVDEALVWWEKRIHDRFTPVRRVTLGPLLMQRTVTSLQVLEPLPDGSHLLKDGPTREEIIAMAERDGFTLPTSDEWEYACAAGARTLFRWGDDWLDTLLFEELRDEDVTYRPERSDYNKPNAFGLNIAQDSWMLEFCVETEVVRGGDGGTAVSSEAMPIISQWLPLASAYYMEQTNSLLRFMRHRPLLRRVLRLNTFG